MKQYKSNYVFTYIFQHYNFLLTLLPGLFIILISTDVESTFNIFHIYILFLLVAIVLGNIIHFLICLFTEPKVYIDEELITVKVWENLTQSIKFEDVSLVLFDHGMLLRRGIVPCSITLFTEDCDKNLNVNHPSFFLILEINKRCKKAKFKFNNYKWYIIWCCVATACSIVLSLLF